MDEIIFKPAESNFSKVRCQKCKNEQVIFIKAASTVKCLVCEEVLAESTGGKAKIVAEVLENYS
ncbi:MAG: 30S ribosomal protein S27e [Candidatus Parvarchaeota archaeon]|jgi:small subunit ribosomal protein S27e|nr:30S ribosomal protein S27e [Candidatus Parvarchaeota archaeon]MCL5100997.1 30S ribosomal protein S27e [Candidatus Parvarchaeota archaeon]